MQIVVVRRGLGAGGGGLAPHLQSYEATPPPPCESNTLVRATVGVVSATFGTVEFGGSFFWWSMKITFFR